MGYSRQLSTTQIQNLYKKLAEKFASGSINESIDTCQTYIKDYYHCYPLLVKICGLYVNHLELMVEATLKQKITSDIIALCQHIIKHSDELLVLQEAKTLLTITYLLSGQPQLALTQLGEQETAVLPNTALRAQCYIILGEPLKAEKSLQIGSFQYLISLVQTLTDYMPLQLHNEALFENIYLRINSISETFNLPELHPNTTIRTHYMAAIGYVQFNKNDLALNCLKRYVSEIKTHLFPIKLRGDDFFTHITAWFNEMNISLDPPRDPAFVKQTLVQSLMHPAFQSLQTNQDFKQLQFELTKI